MAVNPAAALPLRSGRAYLLDIEADRRRAFYGYIMRSMGNVIPFLRDSTSSDDLPNYAVTTTFATVHEDGGHHYLTNLTWLKERVDGELVTDLTHSIGLERRTGIERWGTGMRATQERLAADAGLVAVGALLGIRDGDMRVGTHTGVVGLAYMGDGQIVAGVFQADGQLQHVTLVNIRDPDWRVVFPSGAYDLRGDLGFLYSVLTVTDEEIHLLL